MSLARGGNESTYTFDDAARIRHANQQANGIRSRLFPRTANSGLPEWCAHHPCYEAPLYGSRLHRIPSRERACVLEEHPNPGGLTDAKNGFRRDEKHLVDVWYPRD